ncbi:hypothetical protein JZ751_011133, partial [Albula glossodonta]
MDVDGGDIWLEEDEVEIVTEMFALTMTCGPPVSHVQLACCTTHCAFPWQGKELRVYSNTNFDAKVWTFSLPDDYRCRMVTRVDLNKVEQRQLRHMEGGPINQPERKLLCLLPGSVRGEQADTVETSKPVLRISPCSVPPDPTHTLCLVSSPFESSVALFQVQVPVLLESSYFNQGNVCSWEEILSVIPSGPLMPESPLNAELVKKQVSKPPKKQGPDVRVSVKDMPVTFHARVKSSGYSTRPCFTYPPQELAIIRKGYPEALDKHRGCVRVSRWKMLKANTQKKKPGLLKNNKKLRCIFPDYPEDSAVPIALYNQVSTAGRPTPVCCLQYSGDGKQILCGLGNRSALLYKSSLSGTPAVYTGHDGSINSVGWSHSREWVVTAADDRTARVWPIGNAEPGGDRFSKPVKSAQFYYLDKFLLLSSGSSLHLYLYHLDSARDDIKRYHTKSLCKLVGKFGMSSGTDITCASAINQFFSYIALAAGVDRSVEVFDLNVGRVAADIPDAHARAVHHIAQNQGSMFSTQALDLYSLFLTSAVTDGLKLWDLRTLRCVRRYEGHINRCHPCSAVFSPCGRYIATASEDNCAFIYDVRSSTYLHKLQRHSDTVLTVAFNPSKPEALEERRRTHQWLWARVGVEAGQDKSIRHPDWITSDERQRRRPFEPAWHQVTRTQFEQAVLLSICLSASAFCAGREGGSAAVDLRSAAEDMHSAAVGLRSAAEDMHSAAVGLRSAAEDMHSAAVGLRSAAEELHSAAVDLRSAAEELHSATVDLRSAAEELHSAAAPPVPRDPRQELLLHSAKLHNTEPSASLSLTQIPPFPSLS